MVGNPIMTKKQFDAMRRTPRRQKMGEVVCVETSLAEDIIEMFSVNYPKADNDAFQKIMNILTTVMAGLAPMGVEADQQESFVEYVGEVMALKLADRFEHMENN